MAKKSDKNDPAKDDSAKLDSAESDSAKTAKTKGSGTETKNSESTPLSRREQLRQQQQKAAEHKRKKRIIIAALSVVAAVAVTIAAIFGIRWINSVTAGKEANNITSDKSGIIIGKNFKQGAKTVAIYSDYQCPWCAELEKKYGKDLIDLANQGEIRLEIHTLTFLDNNIPGKHSQRAALAAACSTKVDAYQEYFHTIYENQPEREGDGYTDEQFLIDFTEKAGISGSSLEKFKKCYTEQELADYVTMASDKNSTQLFSSGSNGTPTVLINGKKLNLSQLSTDKGQLSADFSKFKSLIDEQ